MTNERRLWEGLGSLSALLSLAGYFDPRLSLAFAPGLVLGLVSLLLLRETHLGGLLGVVWALGGYVGYQFGADGPGHLMYLVSLVLDGDLDFADEWRGWGFSPGPPTPTGLSRNGHSIGAALLWLPSFLAAHFYAGVTASFGGPYAPNGISEPYLGGAAATTLAFATWCARSFGRWLDAFSGHNLGSIAVLLVALTSPLGYYASIRPHMDHALVFGATAMFLIALDRLREAPSSGNAARVGLWLGLAALCRPQTAPLAALVALISLTSRDAPLDRLRRLAIAAAVSVAVFVPQMVVWKVLYGKFVTIPQGEGWMDWSSPARWSVLISADHGLFNWHPLLLFALVGLLAAPRSLRWLVGGGLFVLATTTWINGSAFDPASSDSFGARRFDVVWPFFATGAAFLLSWIRQQMLTRPTRVIVSLSTIPALWNIGLVRLYDGGELRSSAPMHEVFAGQATQLRRLAHAALFAVPEPDRSALVYRVFFGRYAYRNLPVSNFFDLANIPERMLAGGWSAVVTDEGGRTYRRAEAAGACLRVPLERPADLVGTWRLRSSNRVENQVVTTSINRRQVSAESLSPGWQEVRFPMRADYLIPGENLVCLSFSRSLPGGTVGGFVARLTLP